MSSIDSGINSITAVVLSDFTKNHDASQGDETWKAKQRFRRARSLAVVIGMVIIASSTLVKFVPGNITAITNKTVNLLPPHLFALFIFALFVKNAKPTGVWLGCSVGTIVAVLIGFQVQYLDTVPIPEPIPLALSDGSRVFNGESSCRLDCL